VIERFRRAGHRQAFLTTGKDTKAAAFYGSKGSCLPCIKKPFGRRFNELAETVSLNNIMSQRYRNLLHRQRLRSLEA
jgi:hypothetical protein